MNHQRSSVARLNAERSVHGNGGVKGRLKKVFKKMKMLEIKNKKMLELWRKFVLSACVVALAIDPLFLFIPEIDSHRTCFAFDNKLGITVCVLRTLNDALYGIHFVISFITMFIVPRPQTSFRGESNVVSKTVRKKCLLIYLIVDIVSVLPFPQVVVLSLILRSSASVPVSKRRLIRYIKWIIVVQYIPRITRIYPLYKEVTRTSGTIAESNWIGAALNLLLFMLFSYVFGAFWYVNGVGKKTRCWRDVCRNRTRCNLTTDLLCDLTTDLLCDNNINNSRFLITSCPLIDPDEIRKQITESIQKSSENPSKVYDFGMYIEVLNSGVAEVKAKDFPKKFVYCFWWGLRNLSTFGQSLKPGSSATDIFFAIIICASGLFLFAVLIGNVQKYMISTTVRVEEMKERKRDTEKWMSSRALPEGLKTRIRRYDNHKWRAFRGAEEDTLLRGLPKDLRLETKRHLYKEDLLKTVPLLASINDWLLEALCDRAKFVFYSANSYIVREGDPVEEMLIVTKGELECITKSTETPYLYGTSVLKKGDICGDLHLWFLNPTPPPHLPTSKRTVMTLDVVEGFILLPDDLKFVASHLDPQTKVAFEDFFRSLSEQRRSECSSSTEPQKSDDPEISKDEP